MKARDSGHKKLFDLSLLVLQIFRDIVLFEFISHIFMYLSSLHSFYFQTVYSFRHIYFIPTCPVISFPWICRFNFDSGYEHSLNVWSGIVDSLKWSFSLFCLYFLFDWIEHSIFNQRNKWYFNIFSYVWFGCYCLNDCFYFLRIGLLIFFCKNLAQRNIFSIFPSDIK